MPFTLEGAQDAPKTFKLEGAQDFTSPKEDKSFSQRVGQDLSNRMGQEKEAIKGAALGSQSLPSAALQTLGAGAGMIGDVGAEATKSAVGAIPEFIKQPIISKAKQAANYVANTDLGKAGLAKAVQTKQTWDQFAQKHPEAAKDLSAMGNIVTLPISKTAGTSALAAGEKAAPILKSTGEDLIKAGKEQTATSKSRDFINLVSPKETKKIAEGNVDKTVEKGLLRSKEVVPDKFTSDIASTVSKVPGINPSRSHQYNFNKIKAENNAEAKKLEATLKASNIEVPKEKIAQASEAVKESLAKQTFMVGDAKKASNLMLKEANRLIEKNGYTAAGLLRSRQEFDNWAKGQVKGIVASETNTARKASWTAVRNSLNGLIAESAPDANVKASLTKQFHLFNAMDNIRPKAAKEGSNIVTRGIASFEDKLPTNNPYLKHAATLTGLGLAATHPAMAAAAIPYAAYKGITSPVTKQVVGKGLSTLGDVLSPKLPPKLLPSPAAVTVVNRRGVARPITAAERQGAETARAKATITGLTPDVRRAQIRNEVSKAYEQRELARDTIKEAQIAKIAEQSSVPIAQLVEMSDKSIKELASVLGKEHSETAFAQALRKAIRNKEPL